MTTSRADYYLNTRPIDREEAKKAAKAVYKFCKLKSPKVVFVDSPTNLKYELQNIEKIELVDLEKFNETTTFHSQYGFGATDTIERVIHYNIRKLVPNCSLLCFPKSWAFHADRDNGKWLSAMINLWKESYAFVATLDICYVMERPKSVFTSKHGFHNKLGPAVTFKDGTEIFAYNGIQLKEDYIKNPEMVSLNMIHSTKHKHLLIDLVGLDRYFEMVKNWSPDVSGRMEKFFHFSKMIVPENNIDKWKGYGHLHEDNPYIVKFKLGNINGQYGLGMFGQYDINHFVDCPFNSAHMDVCFEASDKMLWNQLHMREMLGSGPIMGIELSFQNGQFRLRPGSYYYNSDKPYDAYPCHRDIVPAWFKLHMMYGTDAIYETEDYVVEFKDGQLDFRGNHAEINKSRISRNVFKFFEYVPGYRFNFDLTSDTWEGLLDKWARFAFNWIDMHSSSRSA